MQKRNTFTAAAMLAAIALVGAGCTATPEATPAADEAMRASENGKMMEDALDDAMKGGESEDADEAMRESEDGEMMEDEGSVKTFNVDGKNFSFDIKEIRVEEGDTVKIVLTSVGGFHDWVVDEFGAATSRVNEGESTEVTFVADKKGTFQYYCSVGQHRQMGMVGTLIVE